MAHYFFHLRDRTDEVLDPEGLELLSVHAVREVALRAARDTLSHDIKRGVIDMRYRIDVEDGNGTAVHSLSFRDAFKMVEA